MYPLWKGKGATLPLTVCFVLLKCRHVRAEPDNWGGFQFPKSEWAFRLWMLQRWWGWENLKTASSFPLTLFNVPYSVSWAAVAFTLSYQTVTARGHRFCVERAVVCLLLFPHFHIFTLEFQLLVSSCSNMPLGLPWRAFLGTHTPLYALVQCVCPVWTSVEHTPEGHNWPCTDGQLFA